MSLHKASMGALLLPFRLILPATICSVLLPCEREMTPEDQELGSRSALSEMRVTLHNFFSRSDLSKRGYNIRSNDRRKTRRRNIFTIFKGHTNAGLLLAIVSGWLAD